MRASLARLVINAFALWLAARFVDGIELSSEVVSILFVALIFGLLNAIIKPFAVLLTLPFMLLTLGLFTLVINAGMLLLTAHFSSALEVAGFWPAAIGALLISVVSSLLSAFLPDS